ncbi:beta-galactoside alpha-2,6-sialyltransferase 2-like [Oscarella lobularis]|uniref:beta-galactoside alpha-2,6-sialyltransferase 2-like n=1 Tax=Oscarella lobularis TaxID=121494 RepID=UPI0033142626
MMKSLSEIFGVKWIVLLFLIGLGILHWTDDRHQRLGKPLPKRYAGLIHEPTGTLEIRSPTTKSVYQSKLFYKSWASSEENPRCLKPGLRQNSLVSCLKRTWQTVPMSLTQLDTDSLRKIKCSNDVLRFLPQEIKLPQFGTCAVVSSAPSLLKFSFGEEIDAHDAVFRINLAPTKSYEKHVGSRTTVRVLNSQVIRSSKDSATLLDMDEKSNPSLFIVRHVFGSKAISLCVDIEKVFKGRSSFDLAMKKRNMTGNVHINHPIFVELGLIEIGRLVLNKRTKISFSSGTFTALVAMELCKNVTLYEVATDIRTTRKHYYTPITEKNAKRDAPLYRGWHPLSRERELMEHLGKRRNGSCVFDIS